MDNDDYSIGDVVYVFDGEKQFITEAVITKISLNKDKRPIVDLVVKLDTIITLNNIDANFIFKNYQDCINHALEIVTNRILSNSITRCAIQTPHVMRFGEWDPLTKLIKEHLIGKKDLIGVEIGSYQGESTEIFLKSGVFKTLYCIDPWKGDYDPLDVASNTKTIIKAEKKFDEKFKDNNIIKKVKALSSDAVTNFEDESLDFLYIDGNHQFEAVKEDLKNYVPKVKKGGIVAGHDYVGAFVPKAVDEFFGKKPEYLYQDTSWLYIKK